LTLHDPGDQILLKNSKCSKSLQIERERRPRRYEPNATRLGSNGRREREISRSVQNDKQAKKRDVDCTVQSVRTLTWQAVRHVAGRTTRGRQLLRQLACDMACWQRTGWRHVAQSMAATCHMFIGLKSLHLAGVDPVTSGQGKALGKAAQPACPHVLLNICMCCNIFEFANM
jgi:hypothetical protein